MILSNDKLLLLFDMDDLSGDTLNLQATRKSTFLIGCYRSKDKNQLQWIHKKDSIKLFELYNVRSNKNRDGWVDANNPKTAKPEFLILYDIENVENYSTYRIKIDRIYSQNEMEDLEYPSPKGSYLVYKITQQVSFESINIDKLLNRFKEKYTNWIKGKPIYLTGNEIKKLIESNQRKAKKKADNNIDTIVENLPSLQEVLLTHSSHIEYKPYAFTSMDLFSGCGGLTKGFCMAGFRSIFANDIDENCEKTFIRNFPGTPFLCKDITLINKGEVDTLTNGSIPDIIIGGPPCQGFSLANKRRNKIKDDPRNKLFYGFVKFIDWYSPKAFVMENVKGLLSMQNGQVIKTIVEEFSNAGFCGYNVEYKILRASDYGVPQNRERVILIGFRKDLNIQPIHPEPINQDHFVTVDEAISDLPQIEAGQGREVLEYPQAPQNEYQRKMRLYSKYVTNHIAMKHTPRLIERFKAIQPGQSLLDVWETHGAVKRGAPDEKSTIKFGQNNQRLFGDKPAPTIAASFQSNFIHPHLNRNFTAREGARLQSFPDDFFFEGMRTKMSWEKGLSQYQQIGNAVPVLLAKAIAESIFNQLNRIQYER